MGPRRHSSGTRRRPGNGRAGGATRRDVAEAAGVSLTTVTHALNPPPGVRVSDATRARVASAAERLGYRPSFTGRALVTGRTFTVGLLQPRPGSMYYRLYLDIAYGMVEAMQPDEYHPLLLFASEDERFLKPIREGRIDGVLILLSRLEARMTDGIMATNLPMVVANARVAPPADAPVGCVRSDHAGMIRDAVEELCSLGCRNLVAVHDPLCSDANAELQDAFGGEMARRTSDGVVGSTLVPVGDDFRLQIRAALGAGRPWDGVFVDGPERADVLVEEARERGLEPGRDFHLVVCGDQDGATTRSRAERCAFTQQPFVVGREAWRLLSALMRGERQEQVVRVPYNRHAVNS